MYRKVKILIPTTLIVLFGFIQYFGYLSALDNIIHDNIMVSSRSAAHNIVIVGIDERSINEIGSWPWPRFFVVEAINQLYSMNAAVVGVNILYDTVGAYPEYDEAFVNVAMVKRQLVLGGVANLSLFQSPGSLLEVDHFVLPFDELAEVVTIGFLNASPDNDGVIRRSLTSMRYGDITIHSFPFEVYRSYRYTMGQSVSDNLPLDANGTFPIRYVGGPGSFTAVSLWGVINEFYDPAMFRDAIVLIGPYAHGIGDGSFTTSAERGFATHGIEIYANIIQNLIEGDILVGEPLLPEFLVLLFLVIIVTIAFYWLKPVPALIVVSVLALMLLVGARVSYDHLNVIIRVGSAIVYLGVSYILWLIVNILSAQYEKQHIRELFGRFVAPEVVNQIVSGGVEIQLGGVVKEISVLFVDIRGFTAFSEANHPEKVVDMVNRYLGVTSRAIQSNRGTIDKFIGDATMALFNAPNDIKDHALCAVRAAWAMKQDAAALQQEILQEYGVDLQFGIGVNTGTAVIGNMGSDFRMDYTAIGDTINTAARLESNAQKGQIIISDATYKQVQDFVEVIELGEINVKNKKVGILVYSVENVWGES